MGRWWHLQQCRTFAVKIVLSPTLKLLIDWSFTSGREVWVEPGGKACWQKWPKRRFLQRLTGLSVSIPEGAQSNVARTWLRGSNGEWTLCKCGYGVTCSPTGTKTLWPTWSHWSLNNSGEDNKEETEKTVRVQPEDMNNRGFQTKKRKIKFRLPTWCLNQWHGHTACQPNSVPKID